MRMPLFFQDRLGDKVTSMSVNKVWLYFYEEVLIAAYDRQEKELHLLDIAAAAKPPVILPSYKEITSSLIQMVIDDIDDEEAKRSVVNYDDLQSAAAHLVGKTIYKLIEEKLQ